MRRFSVAGSRQLGQPTGWPVCAVLWSGLLWLTLASHSLFFARNPLAPTSPLLSSPQSRIHATPTAPRPHPASAGSLDGVAGLARVSPRKEQRRQLSNFCHDVIERWGLGLCAVCPTALLLHWCLTVLVCCTSVLLHCSSAALPLLRCLHCCTGSSASLPSPLLHASPVCLPSRHEDELSQALRNGEVSSENASDFLCMKAASLCTQTWAEEQAAAAAARAAAEEAARAAADKKAAEEKAEKEADDAAAAADKEAQQAESSKGDGAEAQQPAVEPAAGGAAASAAGGDAMQEGRSEL